MQISVQIPQDLETPLQAEASRAGMTPSVYIQNLLRECLAAADRPFSPEFVALAGSWEDERSVEEIQRDIQLHRENVRRPELL